MNWENEETNYEKQKKAKTSSSNGVLLCPFCGEAPKQPYQTGWDFTLIAQVYRQKIQFAQLAVFRCTYQCGTREHDNQ